MCDYFEGINSSSSISPVECIVIEELACCWVKVNAVLSVVVSKLCAFVPVSSLPSTSSVLVWEEAKIDVFAREFELIHQAAWIALVNSKLLVSVYSNESKADLLNINIMYCGMSKDIVSIKRNRLNSWVVEGTICVYWEVVIFVPSISNNKTT